MIFELIIGTITILILLLIVFNKLRKPKKQESQMFHLLDNQKGLYYEIKKQPESSKFQVAIGFNLEGNISIKRFGKALKLFREYFIPISFVDDSSKTPKFQLLSVKDLKIRYKDEKIKGTRFSDIVPGNLCIDFYLDISNQMNGNLENTKTYIQKEIINKPIDVNVGPGTIACLIKYGKKKYVCLSYGNHLFVDGPFVLKFWFLVSTYYRFGHFISSNFLIRYINYKYGIDKSQKDVIKYINDNYLTEEKDLKYWNGVLNGCTYKFDFGVQPNLKYNQTEGGRAYFKLDKYLIKKIVKETKSRDFVVLYALFNCWLHKTFLKDDICTYYATSILPRNFTICGFYVTSMLMRVLFKNSYSFYDIVNIISNKRKIERKKKFLSFTKIIEFCNAKLPNIGFGVTVFQVDKINWGNSIKKCEMIDVQNFGDVIDDFRCLYQELEYQFKFCFEFKLRVFEKNLVERLAESFVTFSNSLLKTPRKLIKKIDLEESSIQFPIITKKYQLKNKTFVNIFEEIVKKTPNSCAVQFKDETLTYDELNKKSNKLARLILSKKNLKEFVGVFFKKSKELIIAIIGILKAGCVYLPIDPNLPKNRIKYIIENTNCSCVIVDDKKVFGGINIFVDKFIINESLNFCESNLNLVIKPDDLAYTIYTSGSTGSPNGVLIEHSSLLNMSLNLIKRYFILESKIFGLFISIEFDAHIAEIFPTLICGKQLHVIPEKVRLNPQELMYYFIKYKIGGCSFPSLVLSNFPKNPDFFMTTIVVGGGKTDLETMKFWKDQTKYFVNAYGPTETTVVTHTKLWKKPITRQILGNH